MLRFFIVIAGFVGSIFSLPVYANEEPSTPINQARLRAIQASAGRDMVNLKNLKEALNAIDLILKDPSITEQQRREFETKRLFLQTEFEITAENVRKKQDVINRNQSILDAAKKIQPAQGPATTDPFTDAASTIGEVILRDVRPKRVDGNPVVKQGLPVFEYFSISDNAWKEIPQGEIAMIAKGDPRSAQRFRSHLPDEWKLNAAKTSLDVAVKAIKNTQRSSLTRLGFLDSSLTISPEIAKLVDANMHNFMMDMTIGYERNKGNPEIFFNLVWDPAGKRFIGMERTRQAGTYHTPNWADKRDYVSFIGEVKPPPITIAIPTVETEYYPEGSNIFNRGQPGYERIMVTYEFVNNIDELKKIISDGEILAQEWARRAAAHKAEQEARPKIEPPKTTHSEPTKKPSKRKWRIF